ncbi:unnamed protein product [Adineta steineri]|uniref:Uncharacterized protein n=2 Tax=Adineta steineri TaxID=433720 RepID=A0A813XPF5_9BILA|nr:unnamed protein product [Adineta steineri]
MISQSNDTVLNCNVNLNHCDHPLSSQKISPADLSSDALFTFGAEYPADLDYRVELSRRIALTFEDADQIIIFDDIAIQILGSDSSCFANLRGYDRSLLPALWLSTGFRSGGRILVYAPPNPVELRLYLKMKVVIEKYLQREVHIEILYENSSGCLYELIRLFQDNPQRYTILCEEFAQRCPKEFYPEYHIYMLKRHFETITKNSRRSFVFPYHMTEWHQLQLENYSDRLLLPDIPKNDKAEHHFLLKSDGFTALPQMIAVSVDGTLIEDYDGYIENVEQLDPAKTKNTSKNIEIFARAIIQAIDNLYSKHRVTSFVKLDSSGAGGWSSMAPNDHPIMYDFNKAQKERVSYLQKHIEQTLEGELTLPEMAVVEEFIEPQKRSGDIDADYTVCGFVLEGKFFPTSISLCGTIGGMYIEQWTSSFPVDIKDSSVYWKQMFQTYSDMVALEATKLGYKNGIYAGDLFVMKDNQHKQRDWNIRRGGRSSPESLTIFGIPNYETRVTLQMSDFGLDGTMDNIELFRIYTKICERLSQDYGMYILSSAYGYCGKDNDKGDILKFNILVHPKFLTYIDQHGQSHMLPKNKHRAKVFELVRDTVMKILQKTHA